MRSSIIRSITQLIRRPSMTALMFDLGLKTRSLGSEDLPRKRISDKQTKIVTTLILEGLEASEIKTLLPQMQQHLNVVEAKKVVHNYIVSQRLDKQVPEMRSSIMIIRPRSAIMTALMFHLGLSPRSLWSMGGADLECEPTKRISDKLTKIVTTLILEDLEASEIKTLLPLIQQHLNVVEARRVVHNYMVSERPDKQVRVVSHAKVALEGFRESEMETLRPCTEQYTGNVHVDDGDEVPGESVNIRRVRDSFIQVSE
ncbi:hypothetical protein L1987_82941 [Smallanthus sonchifolius]|uniref:Uncharacterized protein n=1 Tax=Smallanthus sonchifolius TaxID=185202 RepID=A0ACB8YBX0_9ASTR|nr:hypothetical protein L1987_82941 [Smallanthus sonchifolius]